MGAGEHNSECDRDAQQCIKKHRQLKGENAREERVRKRRGHRPSGRVLQAVPELVDHRDPCPARS